MVDLLKGLELYLFVVQVGLRQQCHQTWQRVHVGQHNQILQLDRFMDIHMLAKASLFLLLLLNHHHID